MAKQAAPAGDREGSRWINRKPSGEEVAAWFVENAPMHEGMKPERYVTGVTLIPAKERPRETRVNQAGATQIVDGAEQLVWTPYVKVETRVAYFWDLMALHPEWVGVIEPAPATQMKEPGYTNVHLPDGFFRMPVQKADGKHVDYIGQSQRVRVYRGDSLEWREVWVEGRKQRLLEGVPVMMPPAGTKVVPTLTKWGEDPFAPMKVETGSVGRALGMAGMLVVPGSGVATAEDIQEAMERPGGVGAELPGDPAGFAEQAQAAAAAAPTDLKQLAESLIARLQSEEPKATAEKRRRKLEEIQEWARSRKLNLSELTNESPALRGVVKKLEGAVAEAES